MRHRERRRFVAGPVDHLAGTSPPGGSTPRGSADPVVTKSNTSLRRSLSRSLPSPDALEKVREKAKKKERKKVEKKNHQTERKLHKLGGRRLPGRSGKSMRGKHFKAECWLFVNPFLGELPRAASNKVSRTRSLQCTATREGALSLLCLTLHASRRSALVFSFYILTSTNKIIFS